MRALSAKRGSGNATRLGQRVRIVFGRYSEKYEEIVTSYNEMLFRLRRACAYSEDTIQTNFAPEAQSSILPLKHQNLPYPSLSLGIDPFNHETLHRATLGITMQILGSIENMEAVSNDFFTGTHQRIPALSKFRFYGQLHILPIAPRAGFAALCLCILLIQQMPTGRNMSTIQSPLYVTVKNLINLLEMSNDSSLDLLHSRILVAFYEMGHGLHAAAYVSVAVCARTARALGLHRKMWRNVEAAHDLLSLEEEKRVWWAIVCMDRFMGLFNGDSLIVSEDPERTDPLPIEDLLWSEAIVPADIEASIAAPPSLETPLTTTVGQMARECQIAHLVGRAVRHIFNPTADVEFNADEAVQLERTMKAYLPLLAEEELKIGKYCGAFGMCNRFVPLPHYLRQSEFGPKLTSTARCFSSTKQL